MDGEYSQLVVNEYGKGHSVYFAGLPYSPQNCRILLRAIYYAAGMENEMKRYYVTNVDTEVTVFQKSKKIAVIKQFIRSTVHRGLHQWQLCIQIRYGTG